MGVWIDRRIDGWIFEQMEDGQEVDGWIDGWILDRRTDGWILGWQLPVHGSQFSKCCYYH